MPTWLSTARLAGLTVNSARSVTGCVPGGPMVAPGASARSAMARWDALPSARVVAKKLWTVLAKVNSPRVR